MLSQVARSAQTNAARRSAQRTLSSVGGQSSSTSGQVPIITVQHDRPTRWLFKKDEQKATLWVRPWDGITSMPEGLALMRAMERKYGKLKYFLFLRDPEARDMYQPYGFAEFESALDLEQIPLERQVIQLEVPVFERPPPGGIGLDSIHGLLHPEEKAEDFASSPSIVERVAEEVSTEKSPDAAPSTTRVIDVQIERSSQRQQLRQQYGFRLGEERRLGVAKSFVQWGGFYAPPQPVEPVSEEDILLSTVPPPPPPRPEPPRKYMNSYMKNWQPKVQHLLPRPKPVEEEPEVEVETWRERRAKAAAIEAQAEPEKEVVTSSIAMEAVELEETPASEPESEQPRSSKRRERLLELARKNARTPLPESVKIRTPEEEAQKRAEFEQQKEEEKRTKETVRDRLWKLIGGGGGGWL